VTCKVSIPVALEVSDAPGQPEPTPELEALYRSFEAELLVPLWAEIGDLMPARPQSRAVPHLWRWSNRPQMAERAGQLVPVGRRASGYRAGQPWPGWSAVRFSDAPTFEKFDHRTTHADEAAS
jgi:gentisate 1,2-dioxygenase